MTTPVHLLPYANGQKAHSSVEHGHMALSSNTLA